MFRDFEKVHGYSATKKEKIQKAFEFSRDVNLDDQELFIVRLLNAVRDGRIQELDQSNDYIRGLIS